MCHWKKKYTERYSFSNLVCVRISSYLPAKSVKYVGGTRLPLSIMKSRMFLLKLQNPLSCASVTGWGSWGLVQDLGWHEYHHVNACCGQSCGGRFAGQNGFPSCVAVFFSLHVYWLVTKTSSNLSCFFFKPSLLVLLMQSGGRECLIIFKLHIHKMNKIVYISKTPFHNKANVGVGKSFYLMYLHCVRYSTGSQEGDCLFPHLPLNDIPQLHTKWLIYQLLFSTFPLKRSV